MQLKDWIFSGSMWAVGEKGKTCEGDAKMSPLPKTYNIYNIGCFNFNWMIPSLYCEKWVVHKNIRPLKVLVWDTRYNILQQNARQQSPWSDKPALSWPCFCHHPPAALRGATGATATKTQKRPSPKCPSPKTCTTVVVSAREIWISYSIAHWDHLSG